jgi:DNA-binding response OmpR family regulator
MVNSPEKIIILDADPHSREDTRAALQAAGYDVAVFATTREGLDAIHQGGADLLLLDASMQEPSAGEVLATIRGTAKTAGIRVLLLVAAGSEQRASALDLGADDAISRPCDAR